jgi:hypothetical protein
LKKHDVFERIPADQTVLRVDLFLKSLRVPMVHRFLKLKKQLDWVSYPFVINQIPAFLFQPVAGRPGMNQRKSKSRNTALGRGIEFKQR